MPSINLLPENFIIEAYKKREKTAIYILAVVFILSSLAVYGLVEVDLRGVEKSSATLDTQIAETKKKIDTEIKKSDLLSSDYNKKDIEKILDEHAYLSRAAAFPKGLIVQDAAVKAMDFDTTSSVLKMDMVIKDYDSFLEQVVLFKDSFWIDSFKLGAVSKDRDSGNIEVSVELTLRKEMISYHDHAWDFAAGMLAEKANRFVRIGTYTIDMKKSANAEEEGNPEAIKDKETVVATFDGEAYDKDHLDIFEKELSDMDEVKKLTLTRSDAPDKKPGAIGFTGTMELNY